MKKLSKIVKSESGNILVMALIVLCIGGVIVTPLMIFMDTGLTSTGIKEEKMEEFYAVSAGVEDAVNRIRINYSDGGFALPQSTVDPPVAYTLADTINGRTVDVGIEYVWLFEGISGLETETTSPSDLLLQGSTYDAAGGRRTYRLLIGCSEEVSKTKLVKEVSLWLPAGFSYFTGSSRGITTSNPNVSSHHGGTILTWDINSQFQDMPSPAGWPTTGLPLWKALWFDFTLDREPLGAFPWLIAGATDDLYWDTTCSTYRITSQESGGTVQIESYTSRSRLANRDSQVYGDYRAIGGSLERDTGSDNIRDELLSPAEAPSATLSDIPDGANVLVAYLYWSGWMKPTSAPADTYLDEAEFQVPGASPVWVTADEVQILPNGTNGWSYSCRKDVTSMIPGNGNGDYKVTQMEGITDPRDLHNSWSYAGWSLLIVYSHPEEDAHACFLFDSFFYMDEYGGGPSWDPVEFEVPGISGFQVPHLAPTDEGARVTVFVGEGDDTPGWGPDYIKFNGSKLPHASDPYDGGTNPQDNVWNGKSSGLSGEFIDGVDVDTFDATPYVSEGDTSADVTLGTSLDSWNLVYIVLSFRHSVEADDSTYPVGIITYLGG